MRAVLVLMLLLALGAPARADYQAGAEAHERGDYALALAEWSAQAERGNADAQYNLGQMYRMGQGVEVDMAKAFGWYLRAAEQGVLPAQLNVGVMYGRGIGVPRDDVQAYKWLSIAAAQGEPQAMRTIDFLAKRMTKKQIGDAKFQAATWEPKTEAPGGQ